MPRSHRVDGRVNLMTILKLCQLGWTLSVGREFTISAAGFRLQATLAVTLLLNYKI